MICYKCDRCYQEIKGRVNKIETFPRKTVQYARDAYGTKVVPTYKYCLMQTHLCDDCFRKIADALSIVDEED